MGDNEQLFTAIKEGDLQLVSKLVDNGVQVDILFGMRGTPLCAAIAAKQPEIVRFLIEARCDVNAKDFDGEPPLCLAIRKEHNELAKIIINSSGCDLNKVDPVTWNSPLCVAINQGHLKVVKWLIDAGCDINKRGKTENTPLHFAVFFEKTGMIKAILDSKLVQVNRVNKNGLAPIHIAAAVSDIKIMESLIVQCDLVIDADEENNLHDSQDLDINMVTTFEYNTALHVAVLHRNIEVIQCLIDIGCKVNMQNYQGQTPLFLACEANRIDLVMTLLGCKADPNLMGSQRKCLYHTVVTNRKIAPLHLCVTYGNYFLVRNLIHHGADINVQDDMGGTPLMYALYRNKPDIVSLFFKEGITKGLDVNITDTHLSTALYAVNNCNQARHFAQKLIGLGCSVNHTNGYGKSPLHAAVEMDCTEVAEVLLDHGACINMFHDGATPLHGCAFEDLVDMAKILLFYGADVNIRDESGDSSLALALENNSLEFATLLIKTGYNLTKETYFKKSDADSSDKKLPYALADDANFCQWFYEQARQPIRLQVQCRTSIRQHFVHHSLAMKTMKGLPGPTKLIDYLMLKIL